MSATARILGVDRSTVYEYRKRWPALDQVAAEGMEARIDMAEASLDRLVAEGNIAAVCFFLKTQGKRRGYIERQELEHSGAIEIRLTPTEAKI